MIAYFSKTLALMEKNYCITLRKLLVVVKAIKHFHARTAGIVSSSS